MNLASVSSLTLAPVTGTWVRAVLPRFLPTALSTTHTPVISTRFNAGPLAARPFQILYLAETHLVALFEVKALLGTMPHPIPNPRGTWVLVNVTVQLSDVVDLSDVGTQAAGMIDMTAQELTGDWTGYQLRSIPGASVTAPVGIAPTQELGQALKDDPRDIEGFVTVSARVPDRKVLGVFPQNLRATSSVVFTYDDGTGPKTVKIP